jgi:hypothetical protein
VITVDRLALHVPEMSEQQAARLAREVAEALRGWPAPASPIRLERVEATVEAPAAGDLASEGLARAIALAVMRATLREAGA